MNRTLLRSLFLTAVLALGACAGGGARGPVNASMPPSGPDPVLSAALSGIAERYIDPIAPADLMVHGLNGLKAIDPSLHVERDMAGWRLVEGDRELIRFEEDPGPDSEAVAARLSDGVRLARDEVSRLRQVTDAAIYAAVLGGIAKELDGYSRYHGARSAAQHQAQREGYGGIGIAVRHIEGSYRVTRVVGGAPADRAGLQPGDRLVEVDGVEAERLSPTALHARLTGQPGTRLALAWSRPGDLGAELGATTYRADLERERVISETVAVSTSQGLLTLKVERFNASTTGQIARAVTLAGPGLRGIVLDLRGNPGGLLDQAIATADLFLESGKRIVTTAGRHPHSLQRYDSGSTLMARDVPIIVLIDGSTASSAELLAAGLRDHRRAVLVGARSLGKGSVQTVLPLPHGGEFLLTWSRLFTPGGSMIHGNGLIPDLCLAARDPDGHCARAELDDAGDTERRAHALLRDSARYRDLLAGPTDRRRAVGAYPAPMPEDGTDDALDRAAGS